MASKDWDSITEWTSSSSGYCEKASILTADTALQSTGSLLLIPNESIISAVGRCIYKGIPQCHLNLNRQVLGSGEGAGNTVAELILGVKESDLI